MRPPVSPSPPAPAGLWRRTPPAIFTPVFGLLGIGLAWRRAAEVTALPAGAGEAFLGAMTLLYLFCLVAWLAKPLRRPGVILDEMRVLPGRAGLASLCLSTMLVAQVLRPYAPGLALGVAVIATAMLVGLGALVLWLALTGPEEARVITPVWHLVFVGYILGPQVFIPLGMTGLSHGILYATLATSTAIYAVSAVQLIRRIPPAPLRPLLAIHLAPASLLALLASLLGMPTLALAFMGLALAILAGLLAAGRWITAAGFSPLWGAFGFPLAACASALYAISGGAGVLGILGALVLTAGLLSIPPIAWRIFRSWAKGGLAERTNAATA